MSFSSEVKEELSRVAEGERHCRIAELSAIISFCGDFRRSREEGAVSLVLHTENVAVARRFYILIKGAFDIQPAVSARKHEYLKKNRYYLICVRGRPAMEILRKCGLVNNLGEWNEAFLGEAHPVLKNSCCKRAWLRGAFLASGSLTDPEKNYHFEIVCGDLDQAALVREIYEYFDLDARIVSRKKYYVVYMKEGSMISDALNIMGAHVSLMRFENIRILKEVRNGVNRRVNCEAANINKTVSAAQKQIEDIEYIERTIGLDLLPENLRSVALKRLEEPDLPLKELGARLDHPVGKSGVNHRLRKISAIAQDIKSNNKDKANAGEGRQ